jgi:hypothetical protein
MVSRESLENRDRGVFTDADRDYLDEPGDYGSGAAYERREAIKQRLANVLIDLAYFANTDAPLRTELLDGAAGELNNFRGVNTEEDWTERRMRDPVIPKSLSVIYELIEGDVTRVFSHNFEKVMAKAVTGYTRRQLDPETEFVLGAPNVEIEEPYQFDPEETLQTAEEGRLDELDENQLKFALYMNRDDFREKMDSFVEDGLSRAEAYRRTLSKFETETREYSATVSDDFADE